MSLEVEGQYMFIESAMGEKLKTVIRCTSKKQYPITQSGLGIAQNPVTDLP